VQRPTRDRRSSSFSRRRPRKMLEELRRFGNLYIIEGDAITEDDLRSAGRPADALMRLW
jgi:hypothetical protein